MAPRAVVGYLVGFIASNIWRIWLPEQKKVISARDVKFDETKQYEPDDPFATTINIPDYEPDLPAQAPPAPISSSSQQQTSPPRPLTTPKGVDHQQHGPNFPTLSEQPVEQPNLSQIVDEKMDGVGETGHTTPRLTDSPMQIEPTGQTEQTRPHLATPSQQLQSPHFITPASPVPHHEDRLNQPKEPLDSSSTTCTPQLSTPQIVHQLPQTPNRELIPEPPGTPNPSQFEPNDPTPPSPPQDHTHYTPSSPRNEIHGDPQDPRNLTWGPRTRRPRHDPDYEAYTTIQPAFSRQAEGVC